MAVGYTLDELENEITGGRTPASFEPSIDYVVTKIPRFAFEKFPQANSRLTTQMKSVGEVMAIGRTFQESFQKALRGLEVGVDGLNQMTTDKEILQVELAEPGPERIWYVGDAFAQGFTLEQVHEITRIDPWFLAQIKEIVDIELALEQRTLPELDAQTLLELKRRGFSDRRLAFLLDTVESEVRRRRHKFNIRPVYNRVDTCAAEFATDTAYLYSTYEQECEAKPTDKKKIIVLGGGPNRIGQGIEFDYCCVHAALALKEDGYETIMVNCNPETVSTDYDTSDRLYFDPLTLEDVLEIVHAEQQAGPVAGVVVQLGGQTPLGLASGLEAEGVAIVGTPPRAIDLAEDRGSFGEVLDEADLPAPKHGTATTFHSARRIAETVGYPVLVRSSYVLGGRGMGIGYGDAALEDYIGRATQLSPEHPVLVDRCLDDAVEIDVDALYDGDQLFLGGVMEHIEEAGVHSGDSSCALPPITLGASDIERIRASTEAIAAGVGVRGLLNVQYALASDVLYVLEANPRASRTVPFVSKATAVPLAKAAARVMLGESIASLRRDEVLPHADGATMVPHGPVAVKEAVMPFNRFRTLEGKTVDSLLGPEMRSTGEVMGIDAGFGQAFAKAQAAAQDGLPVRGKVFVSVANADKRHMIFPVKRLADLGFEILATTGIADVLQRIGVDATVVRKLSERVEGDPAPTIIDRIHSGDVGLIVNTPHGAMTGRSPRVDGYEIRTAAVTQNVPCVTTVQGLAASVQGVEALLGRGMPVCSLQDWARVVRKARG